MVPLSDLRIPWSCGELVGYVGRSHDDEFRPVAFWYDQGTPVNQVLGTELPATPLPVPYPDADTDICVEEELGIHKLDPCAFYCRNQEEFLPYEYNTRTEGTHHPLPTEQFLGELARYLCSNGLDKILGLSRLSSSRAKWIETSSLSGEEMVARRQFEPLADADGTMTEWEFFIRDDCAAAQAVKACQGLTSLIKKTNKPIGVNDRPKPFSATAKTCEYCNVTLARSCDMK